ncbi:MAG: BTAD domain-containing putative transcriptional regulator [Ilumatobacteraceae bacterium]
MSGNPNPDSNVPLSPSVPPFAGPIGRSRLRPPTVRALARPRISALLDQAWDHRVTLMIAPAGSGKTTAIAAFTTESQRPVAWINSGGVDSATSMLAHLNAALHELSPEAPVNTASIDETLDAVADNGDPIAIVIDDVHAIVGTSAEALLGSLVEFAPPNLRIVLAGRREPGIDLSHLRLMGQVLQFGPEELRFRSWEAEQLFRDLYDTWLRPDDIARLSRRVEGWAAGLQMFHLAARGLTPPEQRRLIDRLNGRARIVREYLAANVLEPISAELRTFLLDTCVVSVITPDLADALRESTGSREHLDELAGSHLFTVAIDDENYRYHEVLRAQVEVLLLERDGAALVAERFRRAGILLEGRGAAHEALHCFARAGDWEAVRRLASPSNDHGRAASPAWIHDLPPALVADDPWLLLARARAEYLAGRWNDASESFRAAFAKGIGADFADQCRRQLAAMTAWADPMAPAPEGWIGLARHGCRRDPLAAASELLRLHTVDGLLAAAFLSLLGGDIRAARDAAERAIGDERAGPAGIAAGLAALALLRSIESTDRPKTIDSKALDDAEAYAERAGFGWLARVVQAAFALTDRPTGVDDAVRIRDRCVADGDAWGAAFSGFLGGLGAARRGVAGSGLLREAAHRFHSLDAITFEFLCTVASATIDGRAQHSDAMTVAIAAARQIGLQQMVPLLVALVDPQPLDDLTATALTAASTSEPVTDHDSDGIHGAAQVAGQGGRDVDAEPLRVQCLGGFRLSVFGCEIDLDSLRPRARALLRMLAIHPANGLHRESIVDALWPDGTAESGIHNLQVAVSAVRKLLANAGVPEAFGIRRQGEAYRLVVATTEASDLALFMEVASQAKAAMARSDFDLAKPAARLALSTYGGELLVEDGPVEYVIRERSRVAAMREAVASIVADCSIREGDFSAAIDVCESIIVEHPYSDELWRLLMSAHRERGDIAAAGLAQTRYEHVLADLGA